MTPEQEQALLVSASNTETIVKRIDQQLNGNGQPGVIKEHSARIRVLERFKWVLLGGGGLLLLLLERLIH